MTSAYIKISCFTSEYEILAFPNQDIVFRENYAMY